MRSSHGGGRSCAMTALLVLLFVGCLAMCVQCRSPALNKDGVGGETKKKSYPTRNDDGGDLITTPCRPSSSSAAAAAASNNSTTTSPAAVDGDGESKIKVVMCVYTTGSRCVGVDEPCHCCVLQQPKPTCYLTHSECVAKCPFRYPPRAVLTASGAAVKGRALQAGSNSNATM